MTKALTKVTYKPREPESTEEYIVMVDPAEVRYASTIPLVDVVDSFQVFHSLQGNQGILGKASKQMMENDFGTSRDDEVVIQILQKGTEKAGEGISSGGTYGKNAARGSAVIDSRGKGLQGI
ncbi:DUF1960-domain-containing protein [Fistulina hepatica ATCC 64428]|nr:DUF1960-domain-containing protein [Fistulina hepatica ATCC 64428]